MTFTYPFLDGRIGLGTNFLSDAEWSVRMIAGRNLWYWRADATLNVERGGSLDLLGVPSEHTMCVAGRLAAQARHGGLRERGVRRGVRAPWSSPHSASRPGSTSRRRRGSRTGR